MAAHATPKPPYLLVGRLPTGTVATPASCKTEGARRARTARTNEHTPPPPPGCRVALGARGIGRLAARGLRRRRARRHGGARARRGVTPRPGALEHMCIYVVCV